MIALSEKPSWLFLEINNVCNLRCKQCHIWMNPPAQPGTLELEEQKQIIREFTEWPGGENPRVVLGGGEALLNPERVLPLVRFAREQNVREFNKHRDRRHTRLSVNAIVCNRTLPFLLEHVDFAKELSADQVRFLPWPQRSGTAMTAIHFSKKNPKPPRKTSPNISIL